MKILQGKGVYQAVAVGPLHFYCPPVREDDPGDRQAQPPEQEWQRVVRAQETAREQLEKLCATALEQVGEAEAQIFEIHGMMLEDEDYRDCIREALTPGQRAEEGVRAAGERFAGMFAQMEDPYLKERAADVKDITERLLGILAGGSDKGPDLPEHPVILAARDLTPSQTIRLDKTKLLALATVSGSVNSHTAILARTMKLPAVVEVGEELGPQWEGCLVGVDGFSGRLYLEPDADILEMLAKKARCCREKEALLEGLRGKETVTRDGRKVLLYANVGSLEDVDAALAGDAEGIGLFRSEFLYLGRKEAPGEEEQFEVYCRTAQKLAGRRVVIRTLDIGADKRVDYLDLGKEENPAMGMRAVRICLTRPELFHTQLRAICRASAYGRIAVMFPMIISREEVLRCRQAVARVQEELGEQGVPYDPEMEVGIMIETPAAALISDTLAPEVDFFSVGTNDLTQYTLAIDRQNQTLDDVFDPYHPAVLRLLELVAKSARQAGIWVGVCGELGADPKMTRRFVEMGIDELSVAPPAVLRLRGAICGLGGETEPKQ